MFSEVLGKFKKPATILVNCAGITRDGFLLKMDEADYDMVQNVNTKVIYFFKLFNQRKFAYTNFLMFRELS